MSERERFEAWMSDDGKWPQAIARDSKGEYLLAKAASDWTVWQAALARSGQAASGSSQGARSDYPEAAALLCERFARDFTTTPPKNEFEHGVQTATTRLAEAFRRQPEAPTAAPLVAGEPIAVVDLLYRMLEAPTTHIRESWKVAIRPVLLKLIDPPARSGAGSEDEPTRDDLLKVREAILDCTATDLLSGSKSAKTMDRAWVYRRLTGVLGLLPTPTFAEVKATGSEEGVQG